MELNQEDIQNILIIMNKAQITGAEAVSVAVIQQKLMKYGEFLAQRANTVQVKENTKK